MKGGVLNPSQTIKRRQRTLDNTLIGREGKLVAGTFENKSIQGQCVYQCEQLRTCNCLSTAVIISSGSRGNYCIRALHATHMAALWVHLFTK